MPKDANAVPNISLNHEAIVSSISFSPDGRWPATGAGEGANLWNIDNLTQNADDPPIEFFVQQRPVWILAFSPDGRWLATGSNEFLLEDNSIRLWDWHVPHMIDLTCRYAGRNFTEDEWQLYFSGEPYRQTCPQWPVHRSVARPKPG
jgi:WD40 repeat protein